MKRSRLVRGLVAIGLLLGVGLVAPAVADDVPYPLSDGCANVHAASGNTIVSANDVDLTDATYFGQEHLLVVGTNEAGAKIAVDERVRGSHLFYFYGDSGAPIDVPVSQPNAPTSFRLLSSIPGSTTRWLIDCGVPPTGGINLASSYTLGQSASGSAYCLRRSSPVAHCVVDGVDLGSCEQFCSFHLDTSVLGKHTVSGTAVDTAGFSYSFGATYTVVKKPQTITDVSIVAALGSGSNTSQLYFVSGTASSGLPVKVTVDPASADVCVYSASTQDPTWVSAVHAGDCIVHLDQSGDDTYDAAPQVTRTIVIDRDHALLFADPAQKGILGLTPTKFAARLIYPRGFGIPLVGEKVSFAVAGRTLCTGVVGTDGYARCSAAIGTAAAFTQKTYTATYAGSRDYYSATATGQLKP